LLALLDSVGSVADIQWDNSYDDDDDKDDDDDHLANCDMEAGCCKITGASLLAAHCKAVCKGLSD
jgi:hypothetical protein